MCASAVRYVASSPGPHPRQGATAHVVLRPYHASKCIQVHTYSHTRVANFLGRKFATQVPNSASQICDRGVATRDLRGGVWPKCK